MSNVQELKPMLTCSRCLGKKPVTEFHRDSKSKRGWQSICKECRSQKGLHRGIDPAVWARWSALEMLAERHSTQFEALLLSEEIRLGVRSQIVQKYGLTGYERIVS